MKNGENRDKLNIIIADDSGYSVPITIWGDACKSTADKAKLGSIVAFKACRVSEYNGKTLNASSDEQDIFVNVMHPRQMMLKKWYSSGTKQELLDNIQSLSTSALN